MPSARALGAERAPEIARGAAAGHRLHPDDRGAGALLPTVRSRCMRLRFGRLTEPEVADVLTRDDGCRRRRRRDRRGAGRRQRRPGAGPRLDRSGGLREIGVAAAAAGGRAAAVQSRLQAAATVVDDAVEERKERSREDVGARPADGGVDAARHRAAEYGRRRAGAGQSGDRRRAAGAAPLRRRPRPRRVRRSTARSSGSTATRRRRW